ncbi:MAG TPA: NAD(P)/FAD-dependent oxidoreductase [Candidatus Acidoferrum sp.]|nr:NAD(P)/FAD-dependent oxidoreductase [Candidatus Acidoferrum sp.]
MRKLPGMAWVVIGFVPWILYWILSGMGLWTAAVVAGLLVSIPPNAYRVYQRQTKAMELVALVFFAAHFLVTVLLGSPLFRFYDAVLINGTLAAMAWGTLLAGTPFTYQYAREDWPREYWNNSHFRRANEIVTAAWGVIFLGNLALGALSLAHPSARSWLAAVLPNCGIGLGVAFSIWFPRWYPRRVAARLIAERSPYNWPAARFASPRPRSDTSHDVIVVGAGIGGLAAGGLLAQRGLKVLVAEQHSRPGGYCTSWEAGVQKGDTQLRYTFDAGVHDVSGLGPRGPVRNLLRQLDLEGKLDWRPMQHEYFLPGLHLRPSPKIEDLLTTLEGHFPDERQNLRTFFGEMEAVYRDLYAEVDKTGGVPCYPDTVDEMVAFPRRHPHAFRWMETPFGEMLDVHFRDPRLKQFLSALTGYLSDRPETLTAGAMAPIFGYYFDGGFYPAGGSQSFAAALTEVIRQHGGQMRLRTAVSRLRIEKGRAVGVELASGEVHRAEAVISNADVRKTFLELVGREHLPPDFARRVQGLEFSASAFEVFLGVDYEPEIAPITKVSLDGQKVQIAIPSKVDPSLAPPGHASLTLVKLIPQAEAVTWDRKAPDYASRRRRAGEELIGTAEKVMPGLREHIVWRQDGTPATCARYAGATGGAIYGPAAGQWRPPNKSPIERLYLAGAGVFPGPGIEAAVISGTLAADAVYRRP